MIKAHDIHKSFGSLEVLKGISLQVERGEVVSIVGQSGAGKTTLLQILGTLSAMDSGSLVIDGKDVGSMNDNTLSDFRNRHIGFVFQFHHLLPEFSALENVMLPALIAGRTKSESEQEAIQLLKMMNLSFRTSHKPSALSGGEQQRVAIARALINNPAVLFADEPSGNLDSKTKEELHKLFFALRDKYGQTIVIVTHDPDLARMCDRSLFMRDGMFVEEEFWAYSISRDSALQTKEAP
jgi:lipoprotein-releasing system ATP-binding protein